MLVLNKEPVGSFMVRESESVPGSLALSLRVPEVFQSEGIAHYIILKTGEGFKIKVGVKERYFRNYLLILLFEKIIFNKNFSKLLINPKTYIQIF